MSAAACGNLPIRTQQAQASQLWRVWLRDDAALRAARLGGCGTAGLQRPEGRARTPVSPRAPGAPRPRRAWPPDPCAPAGGCRSQCRFCSSSRLSALPCRGVRSRQMFIVLRTGAQIAARAPHARAHTHTSACGHARPQGDACSFCSSAVSHWAERA